MTNLHKQKLENLLEARFEYDVHTTLSKLPQPESFKDMSKATERVIKAINNDETITIVGDYDVDGVISTTIMVEFFEKIDKTINWIVPNRFKHGYGLSPKIIQNINKGLLITVDNGITAHESATILKKKAIDLIITDHHTTPENLPKCFAIINPKQKECNFAYENICGAFVSWYFCASINKKLETNIYMTSFLDLVAIATIADMMPMKDINKTLVRYGLNKLANSKREAIKLFKTHLNKNIIDEVDVGFGIAPILNSAGRLDDATIAVKLLLSKDSKKSYEMFEYLINLNNKRKTIQQDTYKNAKSKIDNNDNIIVVASESYHEGVVGIVASMLADNFNKPAFVFNIKNGLAKGSARTSNNIDLYNHINSVKEHTKGFGGHKAAAGVVVDINKLEEFKKNINKLSSNQTKSKIQTKYLMKLRIDDIDKELFDIIERYRPYGIENEHPIFLFEKETIISHRYIGKNNDHQKLVLDFGVELLAFYNDTKIDTNNTISFTASVSKNIFQDNISYNLILKRFINDKI